MGKFGEIPYELEIGANQAIRRNSANTAWEVFTPSAGGGGVWGAITGTLSDQTDLINVLGGKSDVSHTHSQADISGLSTDLANKQATLVSGTNIKTINGSSILGSGDLVISGSGLAQYQVRRILRR